MVQAVSPCLARYVRGSASLMGLISFLSRRLLRRVVINDQARAAPYDLLPERALFRFGSDSVSPFDAARADPATSASKSSNSGLALPGQIRPHPCEGRIQRAFFGCALLRLPALMRWRVRNPVGRDWPPTSGSTAEPETRRLEERRCQLHPRVPDSGLVRVR